MYHLTVMIIPIIVSDNRTTKRVSCLKILIKFSGFFFRVFPVPKPKISLVIDLVKDNF